MSDAEKAAPRSVATLLDDLERPRDFTVCVGGEAVVCPSEGQPSRFTLVFASADAAARVLSMRDSLSLAVAYVDGLFDLEGDAEAAVGLSERLAVSLGEGAAPWLAAPGLGTELTGEPGTVERAREAVNYHYDLPYEFWRSWLDPTMLYTCAYYDSPDDALETASVRKMDHVCRKLLLQPGDRLLDLGCGWGSLSVHAAVRYGADVLGVTLSEHQAEVVRRRAREAGVSERCRVEVMDFRALERVEAFDKVATLGIVEHVGKDLQPRFFETIAGVLRPGGLCLNQGIVRPPRAVDRGGHAFIQRFIFPDASLSSIGTMLANAEGAGLEVHDVESLSSHYVLTLRAWLRRLEEGAESVKRTTSEGHYRAFRLYLAGFAFEFREGDLQVYQTLLRRRGRAPALPLTRAHLYARD
ncbi:MAG TPA: cyclopropane-fatty-acyl-phospholipid synthase family protein [Polyangiaceae bacterium]|nr:cyclopropane-fatty-acyl-phospholipid synthase family protein [Polyangiaceae bacterium]